VSQNTGPDSHRLVDGRIIGGADHTSRVLNNKLRHDIIVRAVCDLRKITPFDGIVVTGTSGLLVGPSIASHLDKHLIVVRQHLNCYSPFMVEGVIPFNYVIVDDLICSGNTVRYILDAMKNECPRSHCTGVYCYLKEFCGYKNNEATCRKELGIDYL